MRRLALALLLAFAVATSADADKAITYSTIVAADIVGIHMNRDGAGNVVLDLTARVRGTDGMSYIAHHRATLTGPQTTTIATFLSSNFLAGFNTQEGL